MASLVLVRCVGDNSVIPDAGPDGTTNDAAPDVTKTEAGPNDASTDGDAGPTCVIPDSGAPGSLDNTFNTAALTSITSGFAATSIAIDKTGNVYIGGGATGVGCNGVGGAFALVRLTPTGNVDTTFNAGNAPKCYSVDTTSNSINAAYAIAIDGQGRIVLGGVCGHAAHYFGCVVRVDNTGALDTSFNGTGMVDIQGANAGVAAGSGNGFVTIYGIGIGSSDKVVVSGSDDNGGSNNPWQAGYVARLTSGGALDIGFATGGLYTDPSVHGYWGVTVGANDDVATVGYNKTAPTHVVVRRLTNAGTNDGTFANDAGLATVPSFADGGFNDWGRSLIGLPNGEYLAAGVESSGTLFGGTGAAKLKTDGTLDTTFAGGTATYPSIAFYGFYVTSALASLCDGRTYLMGEQGSDPNENIVVTKLLANGTIDTTFGTSGITTIAVAGNQLPAQMAQDPITGKLVVVGGAGGQTVVARINP